MTLNTKVAAMLVAFAACSAQALEIQPSRPFDKEFVLDAFKRQYSNDVMHASGRVKWHGKLVDQIIDDTNKLVKIERYADGTQFIISFGGSKPADLGTLLTNRMNRLKSARKRNPLANHPVRVFREAGEQAQINKSIVSNVTVNVEIGK